MGGLFGKKQRRPQEALDLLDEAAAADPTLQLIPVLEALRAARAANDVTAVAELQVAQAVVIYNSRFTAVTLPQAAGLEALEHAFEPLRAALPRTRESLLQAYHLYGRYRRGTPWDDPADTYEAALALARRDREPRLWAELSEEFASALVRGPHGREPGVQERALRLYQDALTVEPPLVTPEHWAFTADCFVRTLLERRHGDWLSTWVTVRRTCVRALEPLRREDEVPPGLLDALARADVVAAVLGCLDGQSTTDQRATARENLERAARFLGRAGTELPQHALGAVDHYLDTASTATVHDQRQMLVAAGELLTAIGEEPGAHAVDAMLTSVDETIAGAPRGPGTSPDQDADRRVDDDGNLCLRAMDLAEQDDPDQLELELLRARLEERLAPGADPERSPTVQALMLIGLGHLYQLRRAGNEARNIEQAIDRLAEGDRLLASVGRPLAETHFSLGVLYKRRSAGVHADNLELAIGYLQSALARDDLSDAMRARALSQLASTLSARVLGDRADNIEQAIATYERALELRPRDVVPVHWAWSTHNLAVTLAEREFGDRRANLLRATALLRDAMTVRTEEALPEHFAHSMTSLAACELSLAVADPPRGEEHVRAALEALDAADRVFTIDRYRQEWLDNRLRRAWVHDARIRIAQHALLAADARSLPESAVTSLIATVQQETQAALAEARTVLLAASAEDDSDQVLRARTLIGQLLGSGTAGDAEPVDGDDEGDAVSVLTGAVEQARRRGERGRLMLTLRELARAHAAREDWDAAATVYTEVLELADELAQQATSLSTLRAVLPGLGELRSAAVEALARSSRYSRSDVLVALERGRSMALGDSVLRDRVQLTGLEGSGPGGVAARRRYEEARDELRAATAAEVRAAGLSGDTPPDPRVLERRRAAGADFDRAVGRIREFQGFEDFLRPAHIDTVLGAALPGRPLVYAFVGDQGGLLVVVHRQSGRPEILWTELRLTEYAVDSMLLGSAELGFEGLVSAARAGGTALDAALDAVLPFVGERLSVGIAALLRRLGARSAAVVACGRLGALPITGAPVRADGLTRLNDVAAVTFAPSARVLVAARAASAAAPADAGYLAVATAPPSSPLPWAEPEVVAVSRSSGRGRLLVGPDATVDEVLAGLRGHDVLHLACHGEFVPEHPERSRLLLHDGPLSLADLPAGALAGVRLVLASACESAATELLRLPDEVTGLSGAFIEAGARYALGTLWPVDDLAAALVGSRVAAACLGDRADPAAELATAQAWLRDLTAAEALQRARALARPVLDGPDGEHRERLLDSLARLEYGGRDRPFATPRFWAPFVLVGG